MAGTSPIRLGSAGSAALVPTTSSSISTDEFGVQHGTITYNVGPETAAAGLRISLGSAYSGTLGSFSGFVVEKSGDIKGAEGNCATVDVGYAKIDPLFVRTIEVDSVLNYSSNALSQLVIWTAGIAQNNIFGFPDPTVSVKYASATEPNIGTSGIYSMNPLNFPDTPDILVPFTFHVLAGSVISYWDGMTFTSVGPLEGPATFIFNLDFISNPRGWQLTKIVSNPIANRSFFAIEEQWRNFYTFRGAFFVSRTP